MEKKKQIYLGLDIGTDSVGYAVTDDEYNLQRFHGADAWGSVIFDAASLSDKRRGFRSARRRLDRRQQRVRLVQEIFASEIAKVDPRFFIRLSESYKWRDETEDSHIFFNDENYTDVQYMKDYPTIHHLISDLMTDKKTHDVRLVYLACAWLVSHRGHFLNSLSTDKIDEITDITAVYQNFITFFEDNNYSAPWEETDPGKLGDVLKMKSGVTAKNKELQKLLFNGSKPEKTISEDFPYSRDSIIRLLAGEQCKLKDIFGKEEYAELDSVSLKMDEEKFTEILGEIGDDRELLVLLRSLYDWSLLADILDGQSGEATISGAKVAEYEQHKRDLRTLKYFVRKYAPKKYNDVFRKAGTDNKDNYVAYSYHTEGSADGQIKNKANIEDFSKYIKKIVEEMKPEASDAAAYQDMYARIEQRTFMPKQRNTDNRVIPHQLYEYELQKILKNAEEYLPFLRKTESGLSNTDKILSVFRYKLPYYVGPLNEQSNFAWIVRKAGTITPWNYKEMIDEDASENEFIRKMTNQCTYLPGEDVLPKNSLCYQKFMVLNEINNIRIDGVKIPVEAKQGIYTELFEKKKKVRRKDIEEYLISNGYLSKDAVETLSGIDEQIHSTLSSYNAFRNLLKNSILTENDTEKIIERASYAEDKSRMTKWLRKEFPHLSDEDIKYISRIKIKDFGRLSRKFLTELEGIEKNTGEVMTILRAMWETNDNLMEIRSDRYTFIDAETDFKQEFYQGKKQTLRERLDDMYISNAVRRPIYRTLAILKDIEKAFGRPDKIFVEMTRGGRPEQKGKRTKSRYQQILDIYAKCKDEDVRDLKHQLESMGEYVDSRLQAERLFLYFMQFGKCAYSGIPIDLEKLMAGSKEYDVDHIYPQAYVKDDSIINNKVLVLSKINGEKSDTYPIKSEIRKKMHGQWSRWHQIGTISDQKYKRLTRSTPFTDDEKYGFINRQLTETSQSTKAVAEILKEKYPDTEIIYTKAGLVSDFRHEFDLPKSRVYNDLHHAVDAYLNVVVGNVYDMKFSKRWFSPKSSYSVKTKAIFTNPLVCRGHEIWDGKQMLSKVKKTAQKNTAHFVKYAAFKTGGLFDQMPMKKAAGLIPLKAGLPTEKYGGYNKASVMFNIPVRYKAGKKTDVIIMSVELMHGEHFLADENFAREYAFDRLQRILGKPVDDISFPMGMRPWKVNTMLSLDGFRVCITGINDGGKKLIVQSVVQFSSDVYWRGYIKKLERFVEKCNNNKNLIYDKEYDKVSDEDNLKLYELYIDKLQNSIYCKRKNSPIEVLLKGIEKFKKLNITEQCQVLLNIHSVFGRMTGGCNLKLIGGSTYTGATKGFNSKISNWKNYYSDVRIIDQSPSGLWERRSENLLELL